MGQSGAGGGATRGVAEDPEGFEEASQRQNTEERERNPRPSRHLTVRFGGVFRIGFADDAVAAVALGGVETGIGALD